MQSKLSALALIILSTLSLNAVDISGTIQYERIHPLHNGGSTILDKNNITTESAKQIIVKALDSSNNIVASTSTNDNGQYLLTNIHSNTNIKIRAYAKMLKPSKWDVKVIDNTNGNAQYVMEGNLVNTGSFNSVRNLKATANDKTSPPFAILDSIYLAMKKVLTADSSVVFPPLKMNWTVNNIESGTYFDGNDNIMIQGDQKGDSDEYDDHIMIHEWGHYFESKFSRADSIGGGHTSGDHLDIRLAFGEGFGNALSGIVTDDPIYFDTMGSNGWNMNLETATHETPGWFSEASIQRILYDLYDSNDDGSDTLSLGFKPLYDVLVGPQKTTKAFTSIFSFITGLKSITPSNNEQIDSIVSDENISTIDDIYGENRRNNLEAITFPIYKDLKIDKTLDEVCTSNTYGVQNKLNNHKFVKFTIDNDKSYPIRVEQNNGTTSDPDFVLYKASPFEKISIKESPTRGLEEDSFNLSSGDYLLDIYNTNNIKKACFYVSVGKVTLKGNKISNSSNSVGIELPKNPLIALLFLLIILILPVIFIRKELKI